MVVKQKQKIVIRQSHHLNNRAIYTNIIHLYIFPRINGPIVQVVRLSYYNFFFVTVRHNFMIFFKIYTAVKPRILLESVNINDFVNRWKKMTVCDK